MYILLLFGLLDDICRSLVARPDALASPMRAHVLCSMCMCANASVYVTACVRIPHFVLTFVCRIAYVHLYYTDPSACLSLLHPLPPIIIHASLRRQLFSLSSAAYHLAKLMLVQNTLPIIEHYTAATYNEIELPDDYFILLNMPKNSI